MSDFTISLGNKNYSSWSLRGWLALERTGATFDEVVIRLRQADSRQRILAQNPSGRVPCLQVHLPDEDLLLWDSLAIAEYLAERFPQAELWPEDREARAFARTVTAEMHAGFKALRTYLPMDLRRHAPDLGRHLLEAPQVAEDVARVVQIWNDCRSRCGSGGDFLFGTFTIADTAYAPVASRFFTYGIELEGLAAEYRDAIMAWPAMQRWRAEAEAEPWGINFPELEAPAPAAAPPAR